MDWWRGWVGGWVGTYEDESLVLFEPLYGGGHGLFFFCSLEFFFFFCFHLFVLEEGAEVSF